MNTGDASRSRQVAGAGKDPAPAISVIVPVYNDAAGLRTTVTSLLSQGADAPPYEVVVVDNGSTDETLETALALAEGAGGRVQVLVESTIRSSYAARNAGARASRGDVLCFVDADMTVPRDYVAAVRRVFDSGVVDYAGLAVRLDARSTTLASRYNRVYGFRIEDYLETARFAPTCCMCVRRKVFEALGGFDARLESSGDQEFGQRVHAAGYVQRYVPEIVLRHPARERYRALLTKERRLARGVAQLAFYHPDRFGHLASRPRSARIYLPTRPARIRERFEAAGIPLGPGGATIFSIWSLPLKWTAALEQVRERRRLESAAGRRV